MIKDRNSKDLIKAEELFKALLKEVPRIHRTEGLNNSDNHDDMVTRLEPDILEHEVKWESTESKVAQ